MIKLEVESYCHTCDMFDPVVVSRPEQCYVDSRGYIKAGDTIVFCTHRKLCISIKKHLGKEMEAKK